MYRVSVQPLHEDVQLGEDVDVEVEDDIADERTEAEPRIHSHQIVKETEDMIEINLSQGDEENLLKPQRSNKELISNFKRAAINSNDQLVAATSTMATGASVIYVSQVISIISYHVPWKCFNIIVQDKYFDNFF